MKKFSFLFALVHSFVFANSPVINLNGEAYIEIYVGDVFIDPGATAFDQEDGDLSSMIQISGSVDTSISDIYTLIYSVSDSDGNTTQTIRDVFVMLFVDAGPDLVFCEDEYVDINEASASDGVSVNWIIIVGYGQLLNADSLSPTYIYSEQDIIDGEVIVGLEATDEAGNANYDDLLISFVSNPIVNIGEDAEINEGDTFQLNDTYVSNISSFFWTSSGSGYFNQIGSLSPTYIPSDSDIANGQVTLTLDVGSISPCTMDSYDSMALTIHQNSSSPPVITIQGSNPITVEVNATYIDPGATAIDETDGDLTSQIIINGEINTNILGDYIIIYSVTDSHGNTTSVNRAVNVVDTTPPVISLNGDSTIYLELGSNYNDPGATVADNYDANLSSAIIVNGSVDTSTAGTYYISYNVSDSSGNSAASVQRTVVVVEGNSPSILVTKTASPTTDNFIVGDTITYTIGVKNIGGVNLNTLNITDTLKDISGVQLDLVGNPNADWTSYFTGSSFDDDDDSGTVTNFSTDTAYHTSYLQPNEEVTFTAGYIFDQGSIDAGGVENIVTVTATADDAENSAVIDTTDSPVVILISQSPSIEVTKTAIIYDDDVDGYNGLGDTIEYTIAVENTGNINLSDLYITDNLTALNGDSLSLTTGPTFISNSSSSTEGTLQPGETATYIATYVISQQAVDAGGVSFTAIATASTPNGFEDVVTESNSTTIVTNSNPSLAVTKEVAQIIDDGDGFIGSGDIIDYTITITNTGNLTLNNVTIQDSLYYGHGIFISELTPFYVGSNKAGAQQGVLQVGETSSYSAQYTIDEAASDSGLVRNTVTVFADDPFGNFLEHSAFVEIPTGASASIEVLKTWELHSDLDSDGIVDDGDTIRFIVSVKNTGNVEVTGITLEDTFSDGAGNLVSFDNGTTTDPRPLDFKDADQSSSEGVLLVGETATYEAFYTVTTPVYNTGLVSNTVTAIGYAQGIEISDLSDDGDTGTGDTGDDPTITILTSQPIDNENILLNGNVYITKSNGLIIKSGDDCFRIKVNNGNVVAEPVNCE